MMRFHTVREAKEYLIGQILAQADRDGVSLSDIERKMLYFSETGWTLPNMMAVSEEFDQNCDQDEYEKKIGQVIRRVSDQPESDHDSWDEAVNRLRAEDHYLLVLNDSAVASPIRQRPRKLLKVILAVGLAITLYFPIAFLVYSHVDNDDLAKWINAGVFLLIVLLIAYVASRGER
jgi:hypothetical protein